MNPTWWTSLWFLSLLSAKADHKSLGAELFHFNSTDATSGLREGVPQKGPSCCQSGTRRMRVSLWPGRSKAWLNAGARPGDTTAQGPTHLAPSHLFKASPGARPWGHTGLSWGWLPVQRVVVVCPVQRLQSLGQLLKMPCVLSLAPVASSLQGWCWAEPRAACSRLSLKASHKLMETHPTQRGHLSAGWCVSI